MQDVDKAIWDSVTEHPCGCWSFSGPRDICNVIPLLAELAGEPLPEGRTLYRLPDCQMGSACVNPKHFGTAEQWFVRTKGRASH